MDIFVRHVPQQVRRSELATFFRSYIPAVFSVEKLKNKTCARLTISDLESAKQFLEQHGVDQGAPRGTLPRVPLVYLTSTLICTPDRFGPEPFLLRCLEKEQQDRDNQLVTNVNEIPDTNGRPRSENAFAVAKLHCGVWEQDNGRVVFQSYYEDSRPGYLVLGRRELAVVLNTGRGLPEARVDIDYFTIDSVLTDGRADPSITLTLVQAPMFSKAAAEAVDADSLESYLAQLSLGIPRPHGERQAKRLRQANLHPSHDIIAGCCLVYRVSLVDPRSVSKIQQTLSRTRRAPEAMQWPTAMHQRHNSFAEERTQMIHALRQNNTLPFSVKFQIQMIVQNGVLTPSKVSGLISGIQALLQELRPVALAEAIRKVERRLSSLDARSNPGELDADSILCSIREAGRAFRFAGSMYHTARRHSHLGLVHRVTITPAGCYLEGPELEPKNRVLRKYPQHTDYFVRVSFQDEDFTSLRMQACVSCEDIYHVRFQRVLDDMINIAGRGFTFLGFSHSSLRSQQCWFMAPFVHEGRLLHAQQVIKGLGDFSLIKCPAKCAARIGQSFSDTTSTIPIEFGECKILPDIERRDADGTMRTFTDGIGKISHGVLQRVWQDFGRTRKERATILQIRFQGAKGVLALDSSLKEDSIYLRPSMIKFEGSQAQDLEVCGAAYRPLPMFLNRQFIKILEDLGVRGDAFLELQQEAVQQLRQTMASPLNAARYLETNFVGTAARVPSLIRLLHDIGLDFRADSFLRKVVDIALIVQLREMKHRARIPVKNAHTLFGVVDETGFLKSGEVHVAIRNSKGRIDVLLGSTLITRAPALHPGDIQIVEAVDVPSSSPLKDLHNCVVFSQRGNRDLPSMLSGGDLDGDLYNVIFQPSLWPRKTLQPANYPRPNPVDIGREVTVKDITDFFVKFMKSDQLGVICNAHMQVADQKDEGTLSPECLILAEMASTAVDFSKTGIPVDMTKFPLYKKKFKPDFMAGAPRLLLNQTICFEKGYNVDDGEDEISALDPEPRIVRYYRSDKALGQLYRAIDEEEFVREIQGASGQQENDQSASEVLATVWDLVQRATVLVQWEQHRRIARLIKDSYNENLVNVAFNYSPDRINPLSESEVVSGNILGKDGGILNKRMRESNMDMKETFIRDVTYTVDRILKGDVEDSVATTNDSSGHDRKSEALERSVACLAVAMEEHVEPIRRFGLPTSFCYIAAAVCLEQVQKFLGMYEFRRLAAVQCGQHKSQGP